MGEIINIPSEHMSPELDGFGLVEVSKDALEVAKKMDSGTKAYTIPIAEISTLGAGVASLIPALRTVTTTTSINASGLYQLANGTTGTVLKQAKDGQFWGAFNNGEGKSIMAKFTQAGPIDVSTTAVTAINPAMIMMTVALFSIEKELGNIVETQKKILSFLEIEKESQIESDIKTLTDILSEYKHSWDNDRYLVNNHKLVLDIKRQAYANMISYQKKVSKIIEAQKLFVLHTDVNEKMEELIKDFKYYRLCLYTYSLATFIEVMLSGNFKDENIESKNREIKDNAIKYREDYANASSYLEQMSHASIEKNVIGGIGSASMALGNVLNENPLISKTKVDDILQSGGDKLKRSADDIEMHTVSEFAEVSNPGTGVFSEKLQDMQRIYNHTSGIFFDEDKVYVIAG